MRHNKYLTIPVALTSDKNYVPFLYTTILSALEAANRNTFYDFYLIVHPNFSSKNKDRINKLKNNYDCNINFIDMKNQFDNLGFCSASWYRLLVADLLPEKYDKCIFLDDDIFVRIDLGEIYNTRLEDNYVAGVLSAGYYIEEKHHCNILKIPSMKYYINTGMMLYNLKQIRKDNITQKFIEISNKNWPSYDQDVINTICYGKIKILPPKYNTMVRHLFINNVRLNDLYTKEEIKEAKNNPCLIHYLCEQKPWKGFHRYGCYWWRLAIKTPYKFYFVLVLIKNLLNPVPKVKSLIKKIIPKKIKDYIKKKIKKQV